MPYKDLQTLAKVRKSSRKIRLFYFFDFMVQILKNEWNFIKKGLNGSGQLCSFSTFRLSGFQHFNADFFNPALKRSPSYTEYRKRQEKAQSTFTNNSSTSKFANSRESLYWFWNFIFWIILVIITLDFSFNKFTGQWFLIINAKIRRIEEGSKKMRVTRGC